MAKLPNSVSDWEKWIGYTGVDVAHNFTDAAGSPVSVPSSSGSAAFTLNRITSDPSLLSAPQDLFADQGGVRINTAGELLYQGADANWSVHATIPTFYFIRFKVNTLTSTLEIIYSGLSGVGNEGWSLNFKGSGASSGISFSMMGTTSTVIAGGVAAADGLFHTALVVIDDAGNRGILVTEWGSVTITSVPYSETSALLCTIGPPSTGASFTSPIEVLATCKGKNASAYTLAALFFQNFEDSRRARNLGAGGTEPEGSADTEDLISLGDGGVYGGVDAFDAEWDTEALLFAGSATLDVPAAAGAFAVPLADVDFAGAVTLDAPTAKGVITKSMWTRERHVDKAVSRIVGQLLGNYNPATFEAIGQNVELAAPTATGDFEMGP